MPAEFVIIGGGNFAVEVATYLDDIWRASPGTSGPVTDVVATGPIRLEDLTVCLGFTPSHHETFATVERLAEKRCVIAVGDPRLRHRFMYELLAIGGQLGSVIHPTAYIAPTATIGAGTVVSPMAYIGPFARVGRNCAINVHAVVGHDVTLGDCAVLSPGADINGHGSVGEGAFLGAGAIISPDISLGDFSKLSAGSVLTRTTDEGFLMHGNPATGRQMFHRPILEREDKKEIDLI